MKRELRRTGAMSAALVLLLTGGVVAPACAQDASERIQELESQMRSMMKELDDLKGKVEQTKEKSDATAQKVDSSVPTASLGEGVGFSDPRGNWALRFNGRIQADYRTFDPNGISASTFGVRRARIGMALSAFKDYQMYVEGEFINGSATGATNAPQTTGLTNGWLEASWFPKARVRLGQFKPLFGLENSMPDVLTDFQERALTQSLLQNLNYDRGIMVHGAPLPGMYYGVTVSNGAGLNVEEAQGSSGEARTDGKDVTGRLVQDFNEFIDLSDTVLHFGGSYKTGSVTTRTANGTTNAFQPAAVQTEARGATFFNPSTLNPAKLDRTITAIEVAAIHGPVKLQSEWWQAQYEGTTVAYGRKLEAFYVSLGWMITGEAYADSYRNGVFGRLKPRNNFSMDKGGGWGAWEVAARYSSFDGSDFKFTNPAGTGVLPAPTATTAYTAKANAYTAQLKWLPNPYTRFLINYVQTEFDTPITLNGITTNNEKAITLRGQLDF